MAYDHITCLAEGIVEGGIEYAFGVTGSGPSLTLIRALEERGVAYYPVSHEAAAVMMAGACCRYGATKAAAIGIKGPGFANFVPGILSNLYEGRPALTITEAYSPSAPVFAKHKRLDHRSVCSTIVKGAEFVDAAGEALRKLLSKACKEYPGPVHLDLCPQPVDTCSEYTEQLSGDASTQEAELGQILYLIEKASCPAVILGSMVTRRLKPGIVDRLKVPVFTTASAKGAMDENGLYAGGVITGVGKEISPEKLVLGKADLVVAVGLRNNEVVQARFLPARAVLLDVIGEDRHEGFDAEARFLAPDISFAIELVISALQDKEWGAEEISLLRKAEEQELHIDQWLPPCVFLHVQQRVHDPLLVLDTGLFCTVGEIVWRVSRPENFCGSSNGRFMGTAIPTAIGAALSSPGKTVVCVVGDGGVGPYVAEIKLAVQMKLPVLFVLMSDGLYGTIARSGAHDGLRANAFTIKDPVWWRAVESMGCSSGFVSNISELEALMTARFPALRPPFCRDAFQSYTLPYDN